MKNLILLICLTISGNVFANNLLVNPGFETGDTSGWDSLSNLHLSASSDYVQNGAFSLKLEAPGGFATPGLHQDFLISPGDEVYFSAYLLAPIPVPSGAAFSYLLMRFKDSGGNDLEPALVSTGDLDTPGNPGAVSFPFLDSSSATETWIFSEVQAVAPENTVSVRLIFVAIDELQHTAYMDDAYATVVPEPATCAAILGLGAIGLVLVRRRKRG